MYTVYASIFLTIGTDGSANNELLFPYGITQDSNTKTLYIADFNNHRVMSYTLGASVGSVEAGGNSYGTNITQLYNPVGLYFDSLTNSLLIANFMANSIVRWTLGASSWTLVAGSSTGSPGTSSTMFTHPAGVTMDPMGNIYIADTQNHRVQLLSAGQTETITIAGISGVSGNTSNSAIYAVHSTP